MNQNPEQLARDRIDQQLIACGWLIQDKKSFNLAAGMGVAIQEYQTDAGPADYILFVNRKPVELIEAKREEEGVRLTMVEDQSTEYATAKLKYINNDPFLLCTKARENSRGLPITAIQSQDPGQCLAFTDRKPFEALVRESKTLRARVHDIPPLQLDGLRDCQVTAITNLERSFRENRPKALVQMATSSGKTFTAITSIYRLLKFAKAKRVLFLVNTRNLGEQAEQEFKKFQPQDDNRLFPDAGEKASAQFVESVRMYCHG